MIKLGQDWVLFFLVNKVLGSFRKIANEKGDRKINLIKQMLVASKESEARYLIRSFQGNLRL